MGTEDEMDDIPRDFSCANPVDIPFLDKKFEGRRRSSLAAIHIYKQQLQSSSRKNSSANADVIRTQIAESTILSSLDSDRVGEGADDDDEEECPTQSEQIETKGPAENEAEATDYATAIDDETDAELGKEGDGGRERPKPGQASQKSTEQTVEDTVDTDDEEEEEENPSTSPTKKNLKKKKKVPQGKQQLCTSDSVEGSTAATKAKSPKKKAQKKKSSK